MTFQQAPFFLGQNDELVEISSALTDWYAHFEVCGSFRNYYNQNAKLLAPLWGPEDQLFYSVHVSMNRR